MDIFIQSIDPGAWNAIIKGPFIPTKEVNGELIPKEWNEMRDDEKIKMQDDQKAKRHIRCEKGKEAHSCIWI